MQKMKNQSAAKERTWKIKEYISELEKVKDEIIEYLRTGTDLDDSTRNLWTADIKECYYSIVAAWQMLSSVTERNSQLQDSARNFLKAAENEYHLPCSVCGEIAVKFKIGRTRFDTEDSLVFCGITFSSSLDKDLAPQLFKHLEQENLSHTHAFMKKHYKREGLDAYCPRCGKIYCAQHYQTREEYDEGYYDCTYGTCPKGHKRIIHD